MTSIRVRTARRGYVFPSGATVVIGRADHADVFLESPVVDGHHARLVAVGDIWHLIDDSVSGTWVAGDRINSLPVKGPVTAFLGDPGGDTRIQLEPVTGLDLVANDGASAHAGGTSAP